MKSTSKDEMNMEPPNVGSTSKIGKPIRAATVNQFGFRYVPTAGQFQAEFRLAHWGGWKAVRYDSGQIKVFSHPIDAALCAANELVTALNGSNSFWRGSNGDEARKAAERLFSRDTGTPPDDQSQDESREARAPEKDRSSAGT